jgi:hypothetical protein
MSLVSDRPDVSVLDTSVPQTARVWNHLLGSEDIAAGRKP